MPLTNYPNGVTSFGMAVVPAVTPQATTGNVWFVQSTSTNPADGTSPSTPFLTLKAAITAATASNGDVIYVMPGHAEAIGDATTLTLNKAGLRIIGLGWGSMRPTFTFGTATTANIPVTAANIGISNMLFKCNFAAVVSVFTATGTSTPTDFWVDSCEFRDVASNKNFVSIITGNATANSMDGLTFTYNRISSLGTTASTTAIVLSSATDRVTLCCNYGNWAILNDTACFLAAGANNVTNLDMGRNHLQKPNTSSTGGSFVSTSGTAWTGMAYDNYFYQLDNTAGIWIPTGTGLAFQNNYSPITGAADKSGLINPAAV